MLRSVSDEDLAPPPSEENIFGQIESIKKQFAEENQQLNRQLEENKVKVKYNLCWILFCLSTIFNMSLLNRPQHLFDQNLFHQIMS